MLDGDGFDFRNEEEFCVGGEGGSLYPTIGLEQQLKQMSYCTLRSLQGVLEGHDDEQGYSNIIDQYCMIYSVSDKILYNIIIYILLQKKNNAFQAIDPLVGVYHYVN